MLSFKVYSKREVMVNRFPLVVLLGKKFICVEDYKIPFFFNSK